MFLFKNRKKVLSLQAFVVVGFSILLLTKLCLVLSSYSYVFSQLNIWYVLYYFFTLVQSDLLILGLSLLFVFVIGKVKKYWLKVFFFVLILCLFCFYLADFFVILFFQQRFSFSSGTSLLSAGYGVLAFYIFVFLIGFVVFCSVVYAILISVNIPLNQKSLITIMVLSLLLYGFPFPQFHLLGVDLPENNVLMHIINSSYDFSLSSVSKKNQSFLQQEKLDLTEAEYKFLMKKKERWFQLSQDDPERVFETFPTSSLSNLTDEYGNSYVLDVFSEAVKKNPELAFKYIDVYKDWKDEKGNFILKDVLFAATKYQPELAFKYLSSYENLKEGNEKFARSLLQYASSLYESPLTFDQLFHDVDGRGNPNNVILVFLESASSVDSNKFGGLNDRLPLMDKISNDGIAFTQLHANGMTSDMGHIATLLGVQPIEYGYEGSSYESFIGYTKPLASFFNDLGYTTTFLSTAKLSFLDQRSFLERNGYKNIIGEEFFKDRQHYTFDAAPDGDLYHKAIDIVQSHTGSYFLTLQTISSHTPYNTPYGRTMEDMYRYEDESFSWFYKALKKSRFFDDGILIVIGDHRKMTPLEDDEFEKWGTTAAAKIIGFIIGNGIPKNQIARGLYQQTDLYYSLLHEFGKGKVKVLEKYNDLFKREILRKWSIKQWYQEKKMNISDGEGHEGYIDLNRMKIIDGAEYFPEDDIMNYLKLSLDYQKKSQLGEAGDSVNHDGIVLISHRGETKQAIENSIAAFKAARDAGADGLEFDVSYTKDGKLIVYHGQKLYNNTQCKTEQRDVCEMNWKDVQKCLLDDGQKIPTFEEVLPQIKNWFSYFFVDFKTPSDNPSCTQDPVALFEDAVSLAQKYKMDAKIVFSSYNEDVTNFLKEKGDIVSALDSFSLEAVNDIPGSYFSYFMTPAENFSEALVQKLQKYFIDTVAYVVNDEKMLLKLKSMGVGFVMTDEIEKMKNVIQSI